MESSLFGTRIAAYAGERPPHGTRINPVARSGTREIRSFRPATALVPLGTGGETRSGSVALLLRGALARHRRNPLEARRTHPHHFESLREVTYLMITNPDELIAYQLISALSIMIL